MLDPSVSQGVGRQGLLSLGANLLQAGGPSAQQQGTLANIGGAIGGVDIQGLTQQALKLQAYRQQQSAQQAVAQTFAANPAKPNEQPADAYGRFTRIIGQLAAIPGTEAIVRELSSSLSALKPDQPRAPRNLMQVEGVDFRPGSATFGKSGHWLVDAETGQRVRFEEGTAPTATKITPQQTQHAEFGAAALAAWQPVERVRAQHPGVEQEVGRILTNPKFAEAVPGFRSSADAVAAISRAGGSKEAQQYMRAKWSFLDNILRTRYATGRLGGPMLAQMAQEFMPGLDTEGNSQVRQNEIQSILSAQGESGFDTAPEVWNQAVKRHGVANLDLQAILQGGGIDSRINDMQVRYPVRRP